MTRTTKISISIDSEQLRLARAAAKSEGMSLSGFLARALGTQLEEHRRLEAARDLYRAWGPESIPTRVDHEAFLASMSRPRKRRAKAA